MKNKGRILVVDDEPSMRTTLSILLRREGYQVSQAAEGGEALEILAQEECHMVLTDLKMKGMDGMELLRQVKSVSPATEVLIFTAYGTVDSAVEAMKSGAYDYIKKPFDDTELLMKVARALEHGALVKEVHELKEALKNHKGKEIVAKSKGMREVLSKVAQVAPTGATVLIEGESGAGKELIARAIHRASHRKASPFIPINCSNLPEALLESELFGYEKGAFTGADKRRKGLFEAAHKGTLFLDEIGDMPMPLQGKILRVLEDGEVRPLGSNQSVKVDIRIVAATNRKIDALVSKGAFREDLFYRLNVVRVNIPPLRERHDGIIPLAHHFLEVFKQKTDKGIKGFSQEAVQAMLRHAWPGNVRELENAVERGVILARSAYINANDLSLDLPSTQSSPPNGGAWEDQKKRHLISALERHQGSRVKAAKELGIGRNTLWRWMKKYGLLQ